MVDDCGCGVCGDSNGLNAGNWVIFTGDKSGCEMVTLFGSDCDDGLNALKWVLHTGTNLGVSW